MNTIGLYKEAVIATMRMFGADLSPEKFSEMYRTGDSMVKWVQTLGIDSGRIDEVRSTRDRTYEDLLRTRVRWYPGAEELLMRAKIRAPIGLVTGSWQSYLDAIEEKLPFQHHFHTITTAEHMGKFPKPHPHSLLLAAEKLGVHPKQCTYIGDQAFDVAAARAAGMRSILVVTEYTPTHAVEDVDMVVKNIAEILAMTSREQKSESNLS